MKHRRAILIGDFVADDPADGNDHLRQLIDAGWQHAVPAAGAHYRTAGSETVRLDHAFLSPSIQNIDTRYALTVAGFRLTGTKDSLSAQPVLVVDVK
jgi:hypothetical protein